ncbi:hypothetical protein A2U01_0041035 [Trifolium medium]|uniref:Uncharacterized protein n=1 Tax=Trifolium medium TaxID=97028 RepID=A0A392Q9E6_9FABA|nr:hypothetical protein [Trifolium medium]
MGSFNGVVVHRLVGFTQASSCAVVSVMFHVWSVQGFDEQSIWFSICLCLGFHSRFSALPLVVVVYVDSTACCRVLKLDRNLFGSG